jgi:hypothetical protein
MDFTTISKSSSPSSKFEAFSWPRTTRSKKIQPANTKDEEGESNQVLQPTNRRDEASTKSTYICVFTKMAPSLDPTKKGRRFAITFGTLARQISRAHQKIEITAELFGQENVQIALRTTQITLHLLGLFLK